MHQQDSGRTIVHGKIIYITATFPPRSGSGVQRPFYQAECFGSLGIPVFVVTSSDLGPGVDHTFRPVFLAEQDIARLPRHASKAGYWLDRIRRRLNLGSYPDSFVSWGLRAFRKVGALLRHTDARTLFVSLGTPSALLAAARQKSLNPRLRLHIDARDLWVGSELGIVDYRRGRVTAALDRVLERWAFRQADSVSCVSPGLRDELLRRYPHLEGRIHVIENGYDEEGFARAERRMSRTANPKLVMRHLGTIVPSQRLENFVAAVAALEREHPDWAEHVAIEFMGGTPRTIERIVAENGNPRSIAVQGYVDHETAMQLMLESDVLLLFWAPGASTVGGKTYEYLRAGRFILGFEQGNVDGPALVREHRRGAVVPIAAIDQIKGQLRTLLEQKKAGVPLLAEPLSDVRQYSREAQNRELLRVLLEVGGHAA